MVAGGEDRGQERLLKVGQVQNVYMQMGLPSGEEKLMIAGGGSLRR